MEELNFSSFVVLLGSKSFQVKVDTTIYAKEAITAACYKFTDRFYIHQQGEDKNIIYIVFASIDENYFVTDKTGKEFCNELIDQQVRYNTNLQFGHIRDLIVEEAFKPVSK